MSSAPEVDFRRHSTKGLSMQSVTYSIGALFATIFMGAKATVLRASCLVEMEPKPLRHFFCCMLADDPVQRLDLPLLKGHFVYWSKDWARQAAFLAACGGHLHRHVYGQEVNPFGMLVDKISKGRFQVCQGCL